MTNSVYGHFVLSYLYFWLVGTVVTLAGRSRTEVREAGV
jgi:hypothetical protein